jgi:hypothetical protein
LRDRRSFRLFFVFTTLIGSSWLAPTHVQTIVLNHLTPAADKDSSFCTFFRFHHYSILNNFRHSILSNAYTLSEITGLILIKLYYNDLHQL